MSWCVGWCGGCGGGATKGVCRRRHLPRESSASSNPSGPLLFLVRHRARRTPWGACSDDFGTQRLCARTATRCDSAPPPPAAHQQIASHTHTKSTQKSLSRSLFLCVSLALDFSPTRTETTCGHPRIINRLNGTRPKMQRKRWDLIPYTRDSIKDQNLVGNWRLWLNQNHFVGMDLFLKKGSF